MTYYNFLAENEIIRKHEICAVQPYLSGNIQLDSLLRIHSWSGKVGSSAKLLYKMSIDQGSRKCDVDIVGDQSRITNALEYLRERSFFRFILPDYIEDNQNRDAYGLYESNFVSSSAQAEYFNSLYFKNIKMSLLANPNDELATKLFWLVEVDSIYDIDLDRLESIINKEEKSEVSHSLSVDYSFARNKFNLYIKYIFNAISEVANISFEETIGQEQISIRADFKNQYMAGDKDNYFSLEKFEHSNGKTEYARLTGNFMVNEFPPFVNTDFSAGLHGIGHIVLRHSADSLIIDYKDVLPPYNDSGEIEDFGIASEYRSDNGCMSVMAFTNCIYNKKILGNLLTLMPIDIQALQHLYGKNETTRAGNTKYILTKNQTFIDQIDLPLFPMDIPKNSIYTLYDASGHNSFDLSLVNEAEIDLNQGAGHFNVIGDNIFIIAYETEISEVIVGAGNIKIVVRDDALNLVYVPSKGAMVTIVNFNSSRDSLILDEDARIESFIGCFHPYVSDNHTEICFQ